MRKHQKILMIIGFYFFSSLLNIAWGWHPGKQCEIACAAAWKDCINRTGDFKTGDYFSEAQCRTMHQACVHVCGSGSFKHELEFKELLLKE